MRRNKYNGHHTIPADKREIYKVAIRRGYMEEPYNADWCKSFVGKYLSVPARRKCVGQLDIIRDALGGEMPTYSNITDDVLYKVKQAYEQRVTDGKLTPSSMAIYMRYIAIVLNDAPRTADVASEDYKTICNVTTDDVQDIFLNQDQLKLIHKYKPADDEERWVKNLFMRECLCGARTSECYQLTLSNIQVIDDAKMIVYYAEKNDSDIVVPLHKWMSSYLAESIGDIKPDRLNPVLREIGRKCGLTDMITLRRGGRTETKPFYEWMHTHMGRKSFASILYLLGAEIREIQRTLGHKSIQTTERYVKSHRAFSRNVMRFFK